MTDSTIAVKEIAFTAYPAKDVASLRQWYEQHLGLAFSVPYVEDGVEQYNESNVSGGYFSLMNHKWMECEPGQGRGVSFEVEDIDKAIASLRARGNDIADAYVTPVCKVASFKDAEGNTVTLHQTTVRH